MTISRNLSILAEGVNSSGVLAVTNGGTGVTTSTGTGSTVLSASPTLTGTLTVPTVTSAAATALTIQSAASTAITIDTSQNVGIGTSTFNGVKTGVQGAQTGGAPLTSGTTQTYGLLRLQGTTFTSVLDFGTNGGNYNWIQATDSANLATNYPLVLNPNGGDLLVGTTSATYTPVNGVTIMAPGTTNTGLNIGHSTGSNAGGYYCGFSYNGTAIGSITQAGTTGVLFNVTSDYRLKNSVLPMTSGLTTLAALKPVTYKWNADDSHGEGFIAHELQAVIPLAVTGEKDAVDDSGKPVHQGVDYSKIVVHLVAAMQELSAKNDALEARLAKLETVQ